MMTNEPVVLFWFRRDLRMEDNTGLFKALSSGYKVVPVFIADSNILEKLEEKKDRRVSFIYGALTALHHRLNRAGAALRILSGTPEDAFRRLLTEYNVMAVYANHDYEPYAIRRDNAVSNILKSYGIPFHAFKDQVIFEKDDVLKPDRTPYTVFTPYSKAWRKKLTHSCLAASDSEKLAENFLKAVPFTFPAIDDFGFEHAGGTFSGPVIDRDIISSYHLKRDIPSVSGTTRLGAHLRFGTVSIRKLVRIAMELNDVWLGELIWREFFMSILWHFPFVTEYSFKRKYDNILWRNNEDEFDRWCKGITGYPIVDAGMRELNETGFMHNRVRMITASFLAKHLLTDWRWGEAYFAAKLLDYELSSNNGNWQWAAGSGCDAAPYFRIFSPAEQTRKYDPDHSYISKWVPERNSPSYTTPVVEHSFARERAIRIYTEGLRQEK
jgi:deoxyribodipyrimidine photo-lyase